MNATNNERSMKKISATVAARGLAETAVRVGVHRDGTIFVPVEGFEPILESALKVADLEILRDLMIARKAAFEHDVCSRRAAHWAFARVQTRINNLTTTTR